MRFLLLTVAFVAFAFSAVPAKDGDSLKVAKAKSDTVVKPTVEPAADTIYDTVYVSTASGIPWNNEYFDPNRLLRHETFDPALSVAYTYSVSFIGGSFGTFAQQSYLAHLAYEFSPELHLYADLGLWMPLYANFRTGTPIAKEDVQQGNVQFVMPGVELEYKPTNNTTFRLMLINENDAAKAYGPWRYHYGRCRVWSDPYYCR
ncbi:MAG: hypothetical protein IKB43_04895 [Fibrobacter sp.]|nr:hypothetical protein [Fibrobacter sp.]